MQILVTKRYVSIGPSNLKVEIGWFDGTTPALFHLVIGEWQCVRHAPHFNFLCIFQVQVAKFSMGVTLFADRSIPEEDFLL